MAGSISLPARRVRLALAFAVVIPLLVACISNRVTIDASDGGGLAQATTLHVSLTRVAETGSDADVDAQVPTPALGPPLDPAVESMLRAHAEDALRAKGYAIGSAAESDLILELAPRNESVSRRTWSSDPDANGARIVQKSEAVLLLRARSRGESDELWTCDARARLPDSALVFGTSAEEVWSQVLAKALERLPDRRVPTRQ